MKNRCLNLAVLIMVLFVSRCGVAEDTRSPLRGFIERYAADEQTLSHRFRLPLDTAAQERRLAVINDWLVQLKELNFAKLDRVGKIDYLLLRTELEYQLQKRKRDADRDAVAAELLPYAGPLVAFCKSREDVDTIKPSEVADLLDKASKQAEEVAKKVDPIGPQETGEDATRRRLAALRASELIAALRNSLREAHGFYNTYDPDYSWWVKQPMERLLAALEKHRVVLRERVVGVPDSDQETIIGLPIGEDGLQLELQHEWIAHTPAELIELADREMKWCDEQMLIATRNWGLAMIGARLWSM